MGRTETILGLILVALLSLGSACGDDTSSGGGDGDGDASGDGDGVMDDDEFCEDEPWICAEADPEFPYLNYDRNLDCPQIVPPDDGPGAARGPCCHRGLPNSQVFEDFDQREEAGELEADELVVSTSRINYSATINHPLTVGAAPLPDIAVTGKDAMEQQLLFQFASPRTGGEMISGTGWSEIGNAHYNCEDGTFSRYSDTSAPVTEGTDFYKADDASRNAVTRVPSETNMDIEDPDDRVTTNWADIPRGPSNTPNHDAAFAEYVWDNDLITQGFSIISFSSEDENIDCHGVRDGDIWEPLEGDLYESYIPMAENNNKTNGIVGLMESTLCTLFAFGLLSDPVDFETLDCEETARCEPGSGGCRWQKLPDSLCPVTDDEQAMWDCHIGDPAHAPEFDGDELRCNNDVPTEAYTIRGGPDDTGPLGQCCDPMGESAELPPCNAWRTLSDVVASSAVIRDDLADNMFRSCL